MAKEVKATFKVYNGIITMVGKKLWEKEMLDAFEDENVIATFRKVKKMRSTEQNSFYWSAFIHSQIDCFKERWGELFTVSQVHDWNKANVWCKEIIVGDTIEKIPDSSTNKTTAEWEERLERCRQFFILNFDWPLPVPQQQEEFKF